MNDSIRYATDTLSQVSSAIESTITQETNIWQWIVWILCVLCIIELFIILNQRRRNKPIVIKPVDTLRAQVQNDDPIDFTNIMNSAFLSVDLYDKLKVKCHPDSFASDPVKQAVADNLFQRITQNRVNYKVLLELKQEAERKLNVTI